ncbi:beta-glucoside-specific PTS transporter subunit IIABC [Sporolactobacillus sp. CQH2019]|uniref:beta-glucoside-specific PTS transporter subunit IIABC n=1 Tax=Sporolactobacillus sp. CQH2019 TaxID=3023512 RepID=UPI002367922B|nr:beta-glucoside-specific PTS transporter subunit IIABC [Sporolactobacillus sp. CQH2019]MDD9147489.1 beta-glucoside-specific PTS transporter subunit IIABC [Sporolactobacillus sp. CQH2019]
MSESLGKKILGLVGGENNINTITHCATRLRMTLKDNNKVKRNVLENTSGILSIVEKGGQFQVVIGPSVPSVYDDLISETHLGEGSNSTSYKSNGNILTKVFDTIAGIFTPLLPLLAGSGVLRGLVLLFTQIGWLSDTSGTYHILTAASTSVFYFLPILLAFTTAKKFGANLYVSAAIMGALIMPEFTNIMGSHGNGVITHFFGLPIVTMTYTSTVIPAILAIWCQSYLEKFLKKHIYENLQLLFVPLISLFLMVPVTAGLFGPFGVYTGEGIANVINWLIQSNGWIAGMLIGGIWNVFVIFGLQWAVNPIMITDISTLGFDKIVPLTAAANFGMAGATLGTFLKTKNKKTKSYTMSALLSIFFAGITEPAIYGVAVRYKRPLIGAIIGGAAGGAFIGGMQTKAFAFVFGGLTTLPAFVGSTFVYYVIGLAICFVVGAIATMILGFDENSGETADKNAKMVESTPLAIKQQFIEAPVSGKISKLSASPDPAFADGSMGSGFVINPSDGNVYAPVSGVVKMLFPTRHAIGIQSDNGTEIMIHIGINTMELNGKYFESHVTQGARVQKGQLLITFDLDSIKKAGYDISTPVIVTNTQDYKDVQLLKTGIQSHGTTVMEALVE